MKRLFNIALGFALLCAVVACQQRQKPTEDKAMDSGQKTEKPDTTNKERDSLNNKVGELDAAIVELQAEVQNLKGNVKQLSAEKDSLTTKVTDMQETQARGNYVAWAALALALVSLVLQIIRMFKKEKFGDKAIRFFKTEEGKNLIRNIRKQDEENETGPNGNGSANKTHIASYNEKANKSAQGSQSGRNNPPANPQDGTAVGQSRDLDVPKNQNVRTGKPVSKGHPNPASGSKPIRKLYAKRGDRDMFGDVYDHYEEGCLFEIQVNKSNEGTFTVYNFNNLKQSNDLNAAIIFKGTLLQKASGIANQESGRCKPTADGKAWKVVDKLILTLK